LPDKSRKDFIPANHDIFHTSLYISKKRRYKSFRDSVTRYFGMCTPFSAVIRKFQWFHGKVFEFSSVCYPAAIEEKFEITSKKGLT